MIAADTSTWIAFFQGDRGNDVEVLDRGLASRQVLMPPPVLAELLSDPNLTADIASTLADLPLIQIQPGFWNRAGALRASVLAKCCKARLGDSLIAQSCLDAGIQLLTRDRDFGAFAEAASVDIVIDLLS